MAQDDVQEVIKEAMEERSPDVVGISVRNIDDQVMDNPAFLLDQVKDVVASCRSFSGAPLVLGGAGYSMYPESALEYLGADMGIQGEGEVAFPTLLDKIQRSHDLSETPGLYLPGRGLQAKRTFAKNLDGFPFPQDHLWSSSSMSEDAEFLLPFQTRRGCPMNCSYCSTSTIEGEILRKRSPALVVEELARQAEKGFDRFYFVDNTFNLPPSYATELCQQLAAAQLDITWRCILYPWKIDEESGPSGYEQAIQLPRCPASYSDTGRPWHSPDGVSVAGRPRRNQRVSGKKPSICRLPRSGGGQSNHGHSYLSSYGSGKDCLSRRCDLRK
jgi:hypothetical protein